MTKRRQRAVRTLLFPLIAIGMMTTMMAIEAARRPPPVASVQLPAHVTAPAHAPVAARNAHELHQR